MLQEPIYNSRDSLSPIRMPDPDEFPAPSANTYYLYHHTKKTDTSILQVWRGTKASQTKASEVAKVETVTERYMDMGIVLLLVVFFIVATERILEGLAGAFRASFLISRQEEIDDDLSLKSSKNIAVLFLLPAALFAVSSSPMNFLFMTAGAVGYFGIKFGIFCILDYVNRTTVFKFIGRVFLNYVIIATALLFLAKINIWLSVLCVIPAVMYLVMASRIILKNNFSVFFYILYLCSLELLPAALMIRLFL
ncbi:MAG: hypothetical protein II659_05690 [Bacteroidales bacterium]|nr:hypothetical protein [Bacteroidales bacterium]